MYTAYIYIPESDSNNINNTPTDTQVSDIGGLLVDV